MSNQFGRPAEDIDIGGWTTETGGTTDLYQQIDETSADDDNYVQSAGLSVGGTESDTYEVKLSSMAAAAVMETHTIRYRHKRIAVSGDLALKHTVSLYDGATEIAAWIDHEVGDDWVTLERELTEDQIGDIVDYTDLRLKFSAAVDDPGAEALPYFTLMFR